VKVPLAGTSRFHRMAPYTRCLRCAGAPRRPPSGSELSLHILSWHAVPYDPGESDHRQFQNSDVGMAFADRLGTPNDPAIRFTREVNFGATWFTNSLRPARLLAPPPARIGLGRPPWRPVSGVDLPPPARKSAARFDPQETFTQASDCERESYNLSVLSVYFCVTPP
jgi:hypothetical protein